jgi:hypothetical protein
MHFSSASFRGVRLFAAALTLSFAYAQSEVPSGRGSTTGDPAASSATPGTSPTTGKSVLLYANKIAN